MKNDVIAIITPVGNEIQSIDTMYQELQKIHWHLWITIIDSFCRDSSDVVLRELAKLDSRIVVLHTGRSTGVARAYIHGVKHAVKLNATKIIEFDIGHPVDLIPRFVECLDKFPLVVGTRFNGGEFVNVPFYRRVLSKLGTILSHVVLQLPFSDCTSGLQGFTNKVAEAMPFDQFKSTGHFYQTEFKFYCQFLPFMEIPFSYIGTESSIKISAVKESLDILFYLFKQSDRSILSGDYTPMSSDKKELLISIKNDLKHLVNNETYMIGYHLCNTLHRLLVRTIHLIDNELKELP